MACRILSQADTEVPAMISVERWTALPASGVTDHQAIQCLDQHCAFWPRLHQIHFAPTIPLLRRCPCPVRMTVLGWAFVFNTVFRDILGVLSTKNCESDIFGLLICSLFKQPTASRRVAPRPTRTLMFQLCLRPIGRGMRYLRVQYPTIKPSNA